MIWLPEGEKIEDMFIRFDRTHRHRTTAYAALMHSIARQQVQVFRLLLIMPGIKNTQLMIIV